MTYTKTNKFFTPNIPFTYGMNYEIYTPWMGNQTHPGTILDIDGDYILTYFISTTPMSKYYTGWNDQQIFPKGIGGRTLDGWGMPNQTQWIHKSFFIKPKKEFPQMYLEQMYTEIEKFFKGDFEDIEFPTKTPTKILTKI